MDSTMSSDELNMSIESLSLGDDGQTVVTSLHPPSSVHLRSHCARARCPQGGAGCPEGAGIEFRSRISPSPSKTRVGRSRSRRRRSRSGQHRQNTSDSSSFLEISHENGHAHSHEHDHYPHDGIHNIDHHHVHVQDQQLHTLTHNHIPKQINSHDHLYKHADRFESLQRSGFEGLQIESNTAAYLSSLEVHSRNRANILFDTLLQKEEEQRLFALKEMAKERTVTTNESTTTTVRRTLIDPSTNGGPQVGGINGGISSIANSIKNTAVGFLTPSEKTHAAIVESSESGVENGIIIGNSKGVNTPEERFMPAREFFAETDRRERISSDYFSGSDTPSRLRESTRRLSLRKPYNDYIAYSSDEEYDDWKQQPKSDYTYSASLTYRKRVTPDRKIGSPNMSRRTLKGGNISYAGTSEFSASEEGSNALDLRSRTIFKPMDALSDSSDGEENIEQHFQRRNRRTRSLSMDIPKNNGSLTRTLTTTSSSYTTTRTLHRGLDRESDGDDGTESIVPLRATPLAGNRSGTPLGRATTPLGIYNSSSRRSSNTIDTGIFNSTKRSANTLDTFRRGYTLGEATITEDIEEEDKTQGNPVVRWSRKTWLTITHVTTIITANIAMAAASILTAASSSSKHSSSSTNSSFFSKVKNISTSIVTTVLEKRNTMSEHLRKKPFLIWIPLLLILLLLVLIAYWWLLQSSGKTAGATDPTENDRPSFFLLLLTLVSDFASWIYSSISSFLASVWVTTTGTCRWLVSSCYEGFVSAWVSTVSMFTWLWSLTLTCLAFLLQMFYVAGEYFQYGALGVLNFFTSSASHLYGFFPFAAYNDTVDNKSNLNDSWSLITWVSNISPLERLSETYMTIAEGAQSSGIVVWNGWLWLVISMGEILVAMGAYIVWLFIYLVTGLWTFLSYIFLTLIGFLTMTASTVSSVASNASTAVVTGTSSYIMPFFRSSEKVVDTPLVVNNPTPKIKPIEQIIQEKINVKEGTVEEIVRQVLESEELKGLIAAAVAESSKEHLTIDVVSGIAKSVVERELGLLKNETSALKAEVKTNTAATAEHKSKILQLREEKTHLINELEMLGQRLYNVEGKMEVADQRSIEDRQHNEEQIEQLIQQINKLEVDHNNLAADIKNCCDDKKVPAILGKIFGLAINGTTDEISGKEPLSAGDIGAWLKSYFVAKDELESRLNTLMTTMQAKKDIDDNDKSAAASSLTQAAVAQTTQIVMNSVLEKLREEMAKQQHQFTEESQQQVSEQVNLQVKAAASILGQQVLEQVQMQKQHLSETLKVNVDSAVQDAVTSALPEAVDSAVAGAVEASVDIAVEKAVSSSVNVAVDNAINTAVPAAVNEAVSVVVEKAVPKAVAEVLPNVVSEQIATAVPEVVASVLPAAVSTAVNETVTSAVSEAMVHVSVNKADDQTIEVNEIVGVVGTTSANSSHESNSNFFVPGMNLPGLNESAVIQIVKEALKKYDADKTGMVDHALETAGGNIISTRCTESYQVHQAEVRILGFPVYRYSTNNPRTIIQPDTMPGQCWAFKGSQGYIVVQLAGLVKPTGFTLEHIPKSLSPNGAIDSAPHEFEVWGLNSENDEGVFLGMFEYEEEGDPLQYFPVTAENDEHFSLVELKINSNHGNLQYTCLYRFRVHGLRLL